MKDSNLFLAFLAGYIDAEGHIGIHSQNGSPQLKIGSYDKGILYTTYKTLLSLGIKSTFRLAAKKGYFSPSYPEKKNNMDKWEINVYMPSIEILLRDLIAYIKHEKRRKDTLKVIKHIEWRYGKRQN